MYLIKPYLPTLIFATIATQITQPCDKCYPVDFWNSASIFFREIDVFIHIFHFISWKQNTFGIFSNLQWICQLPLFRLQNKIFKVCAWHMVTIFCSYLISSISSWKFPVFLRFLSSTKINGSKNMLISLQDFVVFDFILFGQHCKVCAVCILKEFLKLKTKTFGITTKAEKIP